MAALTHFARLVEEKLRQAGEIGGEHAPTSLRGWLESQRGSGLTWEDVTMRLRSLTGERLTAETVRLWWLRPTDDPKPTPEEKT